MAGSKGDWIEVRGAREHNLRDVSCRIPRGRLTVETGLSGSGKSSLAFDTLFAEGQRRYLESLPARVRAHLDKLPRPDVDFVDGLAPAIAIGQFAGPPGPRATLATAADLHDHLRLLFAHLGTPHCPRGGRGVRSVSPGARAGCGTRRRAGCARARRGPRSSPHRTPPRRYSFEKTVTWTFFFRPHWRASRADENQRSSRCGPLIAPPRSSTVA